MFDYTGSRNLTWLDEIACADLTTPDFFVEAGHVISERVLTTCRACPVRTQCIEHAYDSGITGGYFGGLSPGQRREFTLAQALEHVSRSDAS